MTSALLLCPVIALTCQKWQLRPFSCRFISVDNYVILFFVDLKIVARQLFSSSLMTRSMVRPSWCHPPKAPFYMTRAGKNIMQQSYNEISSLCNLIYYKDMMVLKKMSASYSLYPWRISSLDYFGNLEAFAWVFLIR
jgi:hypothetical protein